MSIEPGKVIGDYEIKELIAKQGMGTVWRALDRRRKEDVALKVVREDLLDIKDFNERFQIEARRHRDLDHPHIVPVLDIFEAEGHSCLVMKLVEGESLQDLLDREGKLTLAEAYPIVRDICEALDYAHNKKRLYHRDVKPGNVLLDREKNAYLIDFGIAVAAGEKRRTSAGKVIGTSHYISPERIQPRRFLKEGQEPSYHLMDLYSVGCVFYEMLTGRPPFEASPNAEDSDFDLKQAHVKETPVRPKKREPSIPDAVDELIMHALEKDPKKRPGGCATFLAALEQAVNGPRGPNGETWKWVAITVGAVGISAILLVGLVMVNPNSIFRLSCTGQGIPESMILIPKGQYSPAETEGLSALAKAIGSYLGVDTAQIDVSTEFCVLSREVSTAEFLDFYSEVSTEESGSFADQISSMTASAEPITHVSYEDAQAYADWLSDKTDRRFALPSARQWLAAAAHLSNSDPEKEVFAADFDKGVREWTNSECAEVSSPGKRIVVGSANYDPRTHAQCLVDFLRNRGIGFRVVMTR